MTGFWMVASLLAVAAAAFVLIPVWAGCRQLPEGQTSHIRWQLPVLLALLLPVAALGLYRHWGSSEALALSLEMSRPAASEAELLARLEQAVQLQPEIAEGWYLLGRMYMASNQPAAAARAFAGAAQRGGRTPELLGHWAQARYFAESQQWSAGLQALADEALQANPAEPTTLGLLGIVAFQAQNYLAAADYWQRLADTLPPQDPSRWAILEGVSRARARLAPETAASPLRLQVQLSLAPALRAQVRDDDAVFLVAQPVAGPLVPLAVRRLRVADLPLTLELSDADAMLAGHRLSAVDEIRVLARVSREGNARQGEWRADSGRLKLSGAAPVRLVIDRPDIR